MAENTVENNFHSEFGCVFTKFFEYLLISEMRVDFFIISSVILMV